MSSPAGHPTHLSHLSALLVGGADARSFLQGQLSADVEALCAEGVMLASCNSPQGRVQTVLWMVGRTDGYALIIPTSMREPSVARLRKYVLRSKVTLNAAPEHLRIASLPMEALPAQVSLPAPLAHREHEGTSYIRLPGHDAVLLATARPLAGSDPATQLRWRLEDVRAGLPRIYPATHELFVAQMLNLDLLGAVDFQKGCYTGQEIIARTHYRGSIKRRMFRFRAACPPPEPGTRILFGEQHAGEAVDAVPIEGGCELLAVVSLALKHERLELQSSPGVRLEPLPLPYEVS